MVYDVILKRIKMLWN